LAPLVLLRRRVHRIPHPTFVTIAKRPSVGRDGRVRKGDLPDGASAYFRIKAERPNPLEWIFEFAFLAQLLMRPPQRTSRVMP
jgi:hypothetical protein